MTHIFCLPKKLQWVNERKISFSRNDYKIPFIKHVNVSFGLKNVTSLSKCLGGKILVNYSINFCWLCRSSNFVAFFEAFFTFFADSPTNESIWSTREVGPKKVGAAMNMTPIKCRLDIDISPLVIPYLCCQLQTRGPRSLSQVTLGSLVKTGWFFYLCYGSNLEIFYK